MMSTVAQLSNSDLLTRVKHLAEGEREVTAALITHLAELDRRRLYLAEGCASLFTYCTQILHLSEHAAYGRIAAARASRKFPVILDMLSAGSVNLTTVCFLARHLTRENYREVLDVAQHKTKRQLLELVARLRPQPPVPDVIRRLPTRAPSAHPSLASSNASLETAPGLIPDADAQIPPAAVVIAPALAPRAVVTPLAPQRYKVLFTADAALHEKIRQAQALLRHQIPDGDLSRIFDRALTALLSDLTKRKLAATEHARARRGMASGSRHIPAEVRRIVWDRDGGRCAFVADNGRRCTEDAFVEFHHVVPYALGGSATAENIQLRCRSHNGYEAERDFGRRPPLLAREPRASYVYVRGHTLRRPVSVLAAGNSSSNSVCYRVHRPCQTGARLSRNAHTPSRKSSLV